MNYFLASQSPRRRELLKYLLDDFVSYSSDISETLSNGGEQDIEAQLMSLAFQKAFALEQRLRTESKIEKGDLVIGSDTIVLTDRIMEKPKDEEDAFAMLTALSGREHTVLTSIAVIKSGCDQSIVDISRTKVYFRNLSPQEIRDYIASGEPMDKAGSYGIQGKGAKLIHRIEGDFYAVMGLPISLLYEILKRLDAETGSEGGSERE
ncbi:MAG: Maf family protein [Bacillota bacterium]|nr:Maf family protein [Bacillota bacterium]